MLKGYESCPFNGITSQQHQPVVQAHETPATCEVRVWVDISKRLRQESPMSNTVDLLKRNYVGVDLPECRRRSVEAHLDKWRKLPNRHAEEVYLEKPEVHREDRNVDGTPSWSKQQPSSIQINQDKPDADRPRGKKERSTCIFEALIKPMEPLKVYFECQRLLGTSDLEEPFGFFRLCVELP